MNKYKVTITYDTPKHEKTHIVNNIVANGMVFAFEAAMNDFLERTNRAEIEKVVIERQWSSQNMDGVIYRGY